MSTNSKPDSRIFKIAMIALVVVGAIVWFVGSNRSSAEQTAPAVSNPALTVRTTMLREDKWGRSLEASGSILPWQEAIISAQVQGVRIAEVKASIGDHVKQGDVLVTLDNFARLSNDPAVSHSAQGRIVAPYDGVISAANANSGSMTQPGMELFRLIRGGRLEWRAELTADELMLLRKGMQAEIVVGEGRVIKGTVRAISPSVNLQTRYGYALVSLADSTGIIAGLFAHGTFDISGKKPLLSLPQSAVMQRGSMTFVLVVGADSHVHEREVKVGQRNGDRIEIKQGLKPDEPVVESGGAFLTEGDTVQVVKG
jgi:multidrug efflux pump subunit AcrA (membrane-fusion protein)